MKSNDKKNIVIVLLAIVAVIASVVAVIYFNKYHNTLKETVDSSVEQTRESEEMKKVSQEESEDEKQKAGQDEAEDEKQEEVQENETKENGIYENIVQEKDHKTYLVKADSEISDEEMKKIVYTLQQRCEKYTTEAVVLMKRKESEWYVEIKLPEIEDEEIFAEIVKEVDVKFVGGYGTDEEEVILTGKSIAKAKPIVTVSDTGVNNYCVSILLDEEGTSAFAVATEKYLNQPISIVLDGTEISKPVVYAVISNGDVQVSGVYSYEEAENLAYRLSVGSLGVMLEEIRE